jgi:hypothetical protein
MADCHVLSHFVAVWVAGFTVTTAAACGGVECGSTSCVEAFRFVEPLWVMVWLPHNCAAFACCCVRFVQASLCFAMARRFWHSIKLGKKYQDLQVAIYFAVPFF